MDVIYSRFYKHAENHRCFYGYVKTEISMHFTFFSKTILIRKIYILNFILHIFKIFKFKFILNMLFKYYYFKNKIYIFLTRFLSIINFFKGSVGCTNQDNEWRCKTKLE